MAKVTPEHMGEQGAELLRSLRVTLQTGLSDAELDTIQGTYQFEFCPEHQAFLRTGVPVGKGWPDWRGDPVELRRWLGRPLDGVLFDIEQNGFWPASWGLRPTDQYTREEVAREQLGLLPRLVPLYSHRYLPAAPAPEPAPVFSVYQTDVIYYGADLIRYLRCEFAGQPRNTDFARPVAFWSDLATGAGNADL